MSRRLCARRPRLCRGPPRPSQSWGAGLPHLHVGGEGYPICVRRFPAAINQDRQHRHGGPLAFLSGVLVTQISKER
jgi:hypothetical protein